MITTENALKIIYANTKDFGNETVPLDQATNRVLAEAIVADRAFPPFDRVTMDGIAIRFADYAAGTRKFPILGLQAAGGAPIELAAARGAIEVMTGAMLPKGTDTVIRYEDFLLENKTAFLNTDKAVRVNQNVHAWGSDRERGSVLVPTNQRITPAVIGVAATVGKAKILVKKRPRVAIISTGDELVPVDQQPLPYQIRQSNSYQLAAALSNAGIACERHHLVDDLAKTSAFLAQAIQDYDLIILSGGVSKGKFDFVPKALQNAGVQQHFHRVAQRPGKPLWFGSHPNGAVVFGLPGNPVSSFINLHRYILPWIHRCLGIETPELFAQLTETFNFAPALTYFLQVRTQVSIDGNILAHPIAGGGSGDLANLTAVTGFLELPSEESTFVQNGVYPYFPF